MLSLDFSVCSPFMFVFKALGSEPEGGSELLYLLLF